MATLSDYLLSRRINRKLYDRLLEKLTVIETAHNEENSEDKIELEVNMSAKYQMPMIVIVNDSKVYDNLGQLEDSITTALDEVGFSYTGSEERRDSMYINFCD